MERTVTAEKPVDRVAAYLSDFTNTTEWDPYTVTTELVSGDGGPGTVYRNVSHFFGRDVEVRYVVEELVPGERIRLRGESRTAVIHDDLTFRGDAGHTDVTYVGRFDFQGVLRLAEPLLRLQVKKLFDDGAKRMGEVLARL